MSELALHHALLVGWFVVAAVVFAYLLFVPAPYGRHARRGWGPTIPARAGWVLMEFPAVAVILVAYVLGERHGGAPLFFLLLWQFHYVYRTFVFPALMPAGGRPIPLAIALSGFAFNVGNGYLNGRWLFTLAPADAVAWPSAARLILGLALFAAGFATHVHSDAVLRGLRRPGETGYKIPRGGLYRFVSSPNYLGELVQWAGWAVVTWSLPALAFFVWTAANLLPRALTHHRWYRRTFPDYPSARRAIVPFIL